MEKYILYGGEIEGQYREVLIYAVISKPDQFLVHWDGFEWALSTKWMANGIRAA